MSLAVSNDVLCEIGRIAVYQSHIEGQMALFIRELMYLDEVKGNLIASKLSFWEHMDLVGSLLSNEFGTQSKHVVRFEKFRKSMEKIVPQRNKFVHSIWSFGSKLKSDSATRVKIKGAVLESVPVSLAELQDISKEMEHLEWEIGDLRVRVCHYEANARPSRA